MRPWYEWRDGDLLLRLKVQPKASSNAFAGILDDALKVRITAPPVDGKANSHLVSWLAKQFGVAKSAVSVVRGDSQRLKQLRIRRPESLPAALQGMLSWPE